VERISEEGSNSHCPPVLLSPPHIIIRYNMSNTDTYDINTYHTLYSTNKICLCTYHTVTIIHSNAASSHMYNTIVHTKLLTHICTIVHTITVNNSNSNNVESVLVKRVCKFPVHEILTQHLSVLIDITNRC